MSNRTPLFIVTLLVAGAALVHLARLFWNVTATVGDFSFPGWTGAVFFLILGMLAAWSFRSLLRS